MQKDADNWYATKSKDAASATTARWRTLCRHEQMSELEKKDRVSITMRHSFIAYSSDFKSKKLVDSLPKTLTNPGSPPTHTSTIIDSKFGLLKCWVEYVLKSQEIRYRESASTHIAIWSSGPFQRSLKFCPVHSLISFYSILEIIRIYYVIVQAWHDFEGVFDPFLNSRCLVMCFWLLFGLQASARFEAPVP